MTSPRLLLLLALPILAGCAGTAPSRSLHSIFAERGLPERSPVVLVDLDDTIYEKAAGASMAGAAEALRDLARDHLVVYLTARPTYAKLPGVSHNRRDSRMFIEEEGFPDGPLFTSSVWNWMVRGQGGDKMESFRQLREYGVDRIALAQLAVQAFLVCSHDVKVVVRGRVFLEAQVGDLLGEARGRIEDEHLTVALESDAPTVRHEHRR